jgi:hypothetical protein
VPDFFNYLREYSKQKNPEIKDAFYWTKDNFGLKPVVSIYHVTTTTSTRGSRCGRWRRRRRARVSSC